MPIKRYLFYVSQNYSFAILRPLQSRILARGDDVAWFLYGKEINPNYLKPSESVLATVDDVIAYHPCAVFVPGNVVPDFIPGLKVAVFHGFNSGKLNRRGFEDHFNIRGCFDLYCTQGPNTTDKFELLAQQHQHFSVAETGWPALDPLFDSDNQCENNQPTILMCSTFSRNLTCAPQLFDTVKRLSASGKWRWLIQFHPKMDAETVDLYKSLESDYLTFIETDDVIPLLKKADVMVCDTSSVLIMFVLQGKPVVTFNNISPKNYMLNITDEGELEKAITTALSKPTTLMNNINQFILETHPKQDGMSSERILVEVDKLLNNEVEIKKRKPLNLLRRFKMRKELNYWKW